MANKNKRCCFCKNLFIAADMIKAPNGSHFCTLDHQVKNAYKDRDKGRKIKHKQQKKELKDNDKTYRTKCAQASFNAFIRFRDHDHNCISCNRKHDGQYHAGHYRSVGAHPEIRFEELNCHKQCAPCNDHLSGNITDYRINLVKKIGIDKVEWIEGHHEMKKYTCAELKEIEIFYKNELKMLQSSFY